MLIYIIDNKTQRIRIVINIILKVRKEERRVKALIDSGIKANYIKRRLAIKMNILVIKRETISLVSLKGRRIYSYIDYILIITAKDI
jgi:hypothetical protein